jgi:hypothetical protein
VDSSSSMSLLNRIKIQISKLVKHHNIFRDAIAD